MTRTILLSNFILKYNHIGCVMVSVLVSSVVDRGWTGSSPDRFKPKTIKLVFVAFLLSMQN